MRRLSARRYLLLLSMMLLLLPGHGLTQQSAGDEVQSVPSPVFDVSGDFSLSGLLGVGTDTPERAIHVRNSNGLLRFDRDANAPGLLFARWAPGFTQVAKSYFIGARADGIGVGTFVINDLGQALGGGGNRRLTISNNGNFGLNLTAPAAALDVGSTSADLLLRGVDGTTQRFAVEKAGDMLLGTFTRLQNNTSTTPNGFNLAAVSEPSTVLSNVLEGLSEEGWFAINSDNAIITSPGDGNLGVLSIYDQDSLSSGPRFTFQNNDLNIRGGTGTKRIRATEQGNNDVLQLSTSGEEAWFISDSAGAIIQNEAFRWFANGTANGDTLAKLFAGNGNFQAGGTITASVGFDVAESYWKSEAIEIGDVVRINPESTHSVQLAREAEDRAVIGVVSTQPGMVMGGGAFSVGALAQAWGSEVAQEFLRQRSVLEASAIETQPHLQASIAAVEASSLRFATESAKPEDQERLEFEQREQAQKLVNDLEGAALKLFFERNFVQVALVGRVPVKVDASYGAIDVGDLLVASPTPGRAMRSEEPGMGSVIGKALEPLNAGTGRIMMVVMLR